jgi:cytochrome oxidase Cu insertion factor (SCO1/SenC/PrrC family)
MVNSTPTNLPSRKIEWLVWGGLVMIIMTLLLAFLLAQLRFRMAMGKPLSVIGHVADFTLTNQNAQPVSLANLRGRVWIADVIFTRCAGPCLGMTRQMKQLQDALSPNSGTKLVTLTTDPAYDTPEILKSYAEKRATADPNRWMFLTGDKKQIASLATDSLKLVAMEKEPDKRETPNDLFIHSTIFVIVDKHAQLRGVFETTGDDVDPQKTKTQILAAARRLERER